jgi:hypothetical protein
MAVHSASRPFPCVLPPRGGSVRLTVGLAWLQPGERALARPDPAAELGQAGGKRCEDPFQVGQIQRDVAEPATPSQWRRSPTHEHVVAMSILACWHGSESRFSLVYEHITGPIHTPPGVGKMMHVRWDGEFRQIATTPRRGDHSSLSTRIPGRQHFGRQLAAHLLTAASAGHG